MLIGERLEKSGQFLFRWRGYLPLIFLAGAFVTQYMDYPMHNSNLEDFPGAFFCLFVGIIGIIIRIFTVSFVSQGTSGRGTATPYAECLNTTGMYSTMRNPVYFGNFFTFLAPVLFVQSWSLLILYIPLFALYHERIIFAEEKFLRGKFGQEYTDWAARTPVFFPKISLWKSPSRSFSWKMAYRRESISLFTLIATIWALRLSSNYLVHKEIIIEPVWLVLFAGSAIFYIINCILVHYTKLLED